MHNYAIFAIPGLMPPKAANWRSRLIAPEDGSLRLLLHCGLEEDVVNYAISIPGWRRGLIKDPGYNFVNPRWEDWGDVVPNEKQKEKWPNFLVASTELPKGVLIPKVKIHGCAIPMTELCEECTKRRQAEKDKEEGKPEAGSPEGPQVQPGVSGPTIGDEPEQPAPLPEPAYKVIYFYLDLPPRTLHVGDNVVEVVVNGRKKKYVVRRPDFAIHHRGGITERYYEETKEDDDHAIYQY